MIGEATEIQCKVNNIDTTALADTGSQITSISMSHYTKFFSDVPLQDISKLLKVESAGGHSLPYSGYFECNISIPITSAENFEITVPTLVVPDTTYNISVPLLIGTNVLCHLVDFPVQPSSKCLQVAVQSLKLQSRHLNKTQGVYGSVIATEDIELQPYTGAVYFGTCTVAIPICQHIALVQDFDDSLPIVSSLVNVKHGSNSIPFEIYNNSDTSIHIQKGEKIGNIHQVSIQSEISTETKEFLDIFDMSHLDADESDKLKEFLVQNRDVFAMNIHEMGCTDITEHRVELYDTTPFKEKTRPVPPGMYDELRAHLAELQSAGIIRESKSSPYASNIVIVRKKDNSLRLCTDMRRLNNLTIPDAYNIPRVDVLIDSLRGAQYFASLDLISGYHQIRVADEHIERTAFTTPLGLYENIKMPIGMKNAQSTFQRTMDTALAPHLFKICCVYLDDIIVFGKTKEELYQNLQTIFECLRKAKLTLSAKKCKFFCETIEFLGFSVSKEGVRCSEKHIQDVLDWSEPTSVKEVQIFLGLANYLRKFVSGFAAIAAPLTKLLKGHTNKKKVKFKSKHSKNSDTVSAPWEWGKEQQDAFDNLKRSLTTPPCLIYPNFDQPFRLHCDASGLGLGCALYQEDESGKLHPVAYGSRTLSPSEQNYSTHKLEFLALKWAITTKFTYYLYGSKHSFQVFTDHNPLVYLTTTAKLDALSHRWLADLASYNFEIFYKPGSHNQDADSLSRKPDPDRQEKECTINIRADIFKELCNYVTSSEFSGFAEVSGVTPSAISHAVHISNVPTVDWSVEQDQDTDLCRVKSLVSKGVKLRDRQRRREQRGVMRLLSYWKRLVVKDSILYLTSQSQTGEKFLRLLVPSHMQDTVLTLSHDDLGHLGRDKTLSIAQERYFWVGLTDSVEQKLKTCRRCICAKSPSLPQRAPLVSIETSRPLELVCIDFLSLEESRGKYIYLLVITDHFTNYAQAIPTRNQEAKTVAKLLMDHFILHYGIMERLHSDQGGSFTAKVITHLCKLLGVKKSRTTPFHPEGDGKTERFNRTLLSMLRTLEPSEKLTWKDHVAPLVHAYNCCKHSSTNYSPFYLMFGRCPRLPIDIFLGIPEQDGLHATANKIRENLAAAYKVASDSAKLARVTQAKGYNRKVRGNKVEIGDFVLVKNVNLKGKHKLADKWNSTLYMITSQPNIDIPVFVVSAEDGSGERVLHRNMLLPLILPWPEERGLDESIEDVDFNFDDVSHDDSMSDIEVHLVDNPVPTPQRDDARVIDDIIHHVDVENHSEVDDDVHVDDTFLPADVDNVADNVFDNVFDIPAGEVIPVPPQPVLDSQPSTSPEAPAPRRSNRNNLGCPPTRLGDYVCHSRTVHSDVLEWQLRVAALLQLLPLFPSYQTNICHAIIYVISHY